jgi:enoyl-CoA hydratase
MGDAQSPLTTTIEDGVAVLRFDDGKVNVLSYAAIAAFEEALDRAEQEASAVCIVGNEKATSAGFDLSVMNAGIDAALDLVGAGGRMLLRLYTHPQPVVLAVTGHALAAGALLVASCDIRIGADRPWKIGLNETAIGMSLPLFAVELARERLNPAYLTRATVCAEVFDPHGAAAAGWIDRVVPAETCADAAITEARRLGQLSGDAYRRTKRTLRQPMVDRVRAGGAVDSESFTVEAPAS